MNYWNRKKKDVTIFHNIQSAYSRIVLKNWSLQLPVYKCYCFIDIIEKDTTEIITSNAVVS